MGWFGLVLDGTVIALLLVALPLVLRLERRLAAVRLEGAALDKSAAGLSEATRMAEAASMRLRASAEGAGRQVADRLAKAEPVRDDLRYLVERAESIADRLDGLVRTARPALQDAPAHAEAAPRETPARMAAPAATGRSQAEQDLLRALVRTLPGSKR